VCFLAKQKGDTPIEHMSCILVKGDAPTECVSRILVKGDTRCGGASPFYLLCTKKESLLIILHGNAPCASTWRAHWHAYAKCMCPNGHDALGRKKHCMKHKLLEFFDPVVSHGFKSIVACVLVGEVGQNFYTVLDEAS
jgi:hypothetical protein